MYLEYILTNNFVRISQWHKITIHHIISNIDMFPLISPIGIVSINELILIICQYDVKIVRPYHTRDNVLILPSTLPLFYIYILVTSGSKIFFEIKQIFLFNWTKNCLIVHVIRNCEIMKLFQMYNRINHYKM